MMPGLCEGETSSVCFIGSVRFDVHRVSVGVGIVEGFESFLGLGWEFDGFYMTKFFNFGCASFSIFLNVFRQIIASSNDLIRKCS